MRNLLLITKVIKSVHDLPFYVFINYCRSDFHSLEFIIEYAFVNRGEGVEISRGHWELSVTHEPQSISWVQPGERV